MVVCEVDHKTNTYSNYCEFTVKRDCINYGLLKGTFGELQMTIPKRGGMIINYKKYDTKRD